MSLSIETQTLMAYIDGELEAAECQQVEQALDAQPQLRQQYDQLSQLDGLLGAALSPALQGVQPELDSSKPAQHSQAWWQRLLQPCWWRQFGVVMAWRAGGATALLVMGVLIGSGYERQAQQKALVAQQQQLQHVIDQALETRLSGDSMLWGDGAGSITPVRTYRSRHGQFCREFVFHGGDAVIVDARGGVACRDEQGWQIKAHYYL